VPSQAVGPIVTTTDPPRPRGARRAKAQSPPATRCRAIRRSKRLANQWRTSGSGFGWCSGSRPFVTPCILGPLEQLGAEPIAPQHTALARPSASSRGRGGHTPPPPPLPPPRRRVSLCLLYPGPSNGIRRPVGRCFASSGVRGRGRPPLVAGAPPKQMAIRSKPKWELNDSAPRRQTRWPTVVAPVH
jgi:hypothetical protein